jgi:uncharacterized protein (DUF433 family)/DNA-binding transcriptional MerR regulator
MILDVNPYVGVGLYSIPEAARLVGVPAATLRRWVPRDSSVSPLIPGPHGALLDREPPPAASRMVTFADLMELHLTNLFRRRGVTLPTIRAIARQAARELNTDHPLAAEQFQTRAPLLIAAMAEATPSSARLFRELSRLQRGLDEIAAPFFQKLEYESGQAHRYWPLGKHRPVVLDPSRSFGKPIDSGSGVPTSVLYGLYRAGEPIERVAGWYEVDPEAVRAAVEYEQSPAG